MTNDQIKWLGGVGVIVIAGIGFFLGTSGTEPTPAVAQGVDWQELAIEEALTRAEAEGTRVFVKFDAEWCSYCRKLDEEVLSTAAGAALTEDLIAVTFDFDAEENRSLIERYVVLGLPTSLVLTPDGTQVGRIMGYHGRDEWIAEFEAAKIAEDPVPDLRVAYDAAPDDPEAALRLGQALLVSGSAEEGHALLERATFLAVPAAAGQSEEAEFAAEALFTLGRYHHRVRRDPRTARHVWRELAARFPDSEWAGGAWWWYAKAQAELGQHDLGLVVLRRRAEESPDDVGIVSQWGEFVMTHELEEERADALAALSPLLEGATEDERAELDELAGKLRGETSP